MPLRSYLEAMARNIPLVGLLALALVAAAVPALAQSADDIPSIVAPEKAAPKEQPAPKPAAPRKRPRGSSTLVTPVPLPPPLHYNPPPVPTGVPPARPVPPSMVVPQTGMVLPNLPAPGTGANETSQDRALRCAHQAGAYGPAQTGDRNAYVGGCINQ